MKAYQDQQRSEHEGMKASLQSVGVQDDEDAQQQLVLGSAVS